ncbi:MAG: OsmC family protein [Bacteroidetes bacterium]|nr:OsmC family protein [Bacteroidota bacterium]MBK9672853.1 OsmC family protein [Bacteroidota bacterium]MBK9801052.1 OsmC family protein [Bacteroidota bacterium]MBP6412770.1 OsmC family protein [Bacteroidia bacterium]
METIKIHYPGNLRTQATHVASGVELITDAPLDNHGKGESFSPTDLLCSSLGSCMLTLMGIAANTHSIDLVGTDVSVTKIMVSNPRKVGEIKISIYFPKNHYSDKEKKILELAALTCPVYLSLHDSVIKTVEFIY